MTALSQTQHSTTLTPISELPLLSDVFDVQPGTTFLLIINTITSSIPPSAHFSLISTILSTIEAQSTLLLNGTTYHRRVFTLIESTTTFISSSYQKKQKTEKRFSFPRVVEGMDDDHGVLITAERMVDAFVPKDLREMNWVGVGVDCVIWIKDVKGRKRRDESRSGRRSDVDAGCEDDVSAASDESEPDVGDDEDEDEDDDEDGSNESGDVSMQMDVSKSMEDGPANDSEEEMEKLGERVGGIGFEQ